mmetsp:Transcript_709/g.3025  ORF Transcript_709/g.3025 Transcript_709/m.3025 type:complete len:251 (-) Transcript_709:214-966(-)
MPSRRRCNSSVAVLSRSSVDSNRSSSSLARSFCAPSSFRASSPLAPLPSQSRMSPLISSTSLTLRDGELRPPPPPASASSPSASSPSERRSISSRVLAFRPSDTPGMGAPPRAAVYFDDLKPNPGLPPAVPPAVPPPCSVPPPAVRRRAPGTPGSVTQSPVGPAARSSLRASLDVLIAKSACGGRLARRPSFGCVSNGGSRRPILRQASMSRAWLLRLRFHVALCSGSWSLRSHRSSRTLCTCATSSSLC